MESSNKKRDRMHREREDERPKHARHGIRRGSSRDYKTRRSNPRRDEYRGTESRQHHQQRPRPSRSHRYETPLGYWDQRNAHSDLGGYGCCPHGKRQRKHVRFLIPDDDDRGREQGPFCRHSPAAYETDRPRKRYEYKEPELRPNRPSSPPPRARQRSSERTRASRRHGSSSQLGGDDDGHNRVHEDRGSTLRGPIIRLLLCGVLFAVKHLAKKAQDRHDRHSDSKRHGR